MSQLLSQGAFGCIFYPGFNCKNETTEKEKNTVTKLQVNDFTAKNEVLIGKILKTIPNYEFFFIPVISTCSIAYAKLNNKDIDKCEVVSKNNKKYLLLELPYVKNISFEKLFLNTLISNKHRFLLYIETFKYIVISISHLIEKNVVHFDLKEDNILYSIKYENPLLIDYGLSIPMNKLKSSNINRTSNLKEYFYTYGPDYYIWSLEVHTINFLLHKSDVLTSNDIDSMISTYIKYNSALFIFSSEFTDNYSKMCKEFLSQYIDKDKNDIIDELLSFHKSWDLYALSIMYLKFFNILFKDGFFDSKFIVAFSELLLTNISPDPNKRLSVDITLKKYQDIFFINEKSNNYLTLIDNINYKVSN